MKTFINKGRLLLDLAAAMVTSTGAVSCSEAVDVKTHDLEHTYLVVEAFLTDRPEDEQKVRLSESIAYFSKEEVPTVSYAEIIVTDGSQSASYTEDPETPGLYKAPAGFCGKIGNKYSLKINAVIGGRERHYSAESTMPEAGFQLDSIDYSYMGGTLMPLDSIWTVSVWGKDEPFASWFMIGGDLNGNQFPYEMSTAIDDIYFAGQQIEAFPLTMIEQTKRNRDRFGDCCKFLETGDVLTISAMSIPKECYEFLMALSSNSTSGISIPMLSSQPANCPTNIKGDLAMGFFAACPKRSVSRTVDDPLRRMPIGQNQKPLN